MSRTIINVGAVIDATNQINSAKSSVSSAKSSFTQTKNSIDSKIQNRSNIGSRLSTVQSQLSSIDSQIGKIRSMVQAGANLYRSTDDTVESWRDEIRNNVGARSVAQIASTWASYFDNPKGQKKVDQKEVSEPKQKEKKSLWSWDDTWDVVGEFGPVGTGISSVGQFFTGGVTCKSVLKFAKGAADITGDVAKNISSNTSFDWKSLTNLKPVQNETAGKVLSDAIDDYNFSKAPNTAGKVAVAAKWVGTGLTVATSAVDNYQEYKDGEISAVRSVAETVGESAVKVVTGVACKAAATAIVTGIAATVGAPAVATAAVIGVVAVGISWAADKVCEAITGKDLAEATSDLVLDTAEKVGKAVGSAAKKVAGAVSGWWNKLWK